MNRRTPGPWSISFKNNTVVGPERDDGNRLVICEMGGSLDNPSVLADAALVAAAPEMLRWLAAHYEREEGPGRTDRPQYEELREILASVRGQQPTSDTQD